MPLSLKSLIKSKKPKNYLALDFGANSLKFLSLSSQHSSVHQAAKLKLNYLGIEKTPAGSFHNGVLSNPSLVAKLIQEIIVKNSIVEKNVIFSIPTTNVFIKKVLVNAASSKDLIEKIPFEAANYIPQSGKDVFFDYQVLKKQGKNSFEVLIAAAKKEVVNNYLEAINLAGLQPLIADVDTFSLENTFEHLYADSKNETIAILNLGESYSNITILQDGQLLTNGDIPKGARQYREALKNEFALDSYEIENILSAKSPIDDKFANAINVLTESLAEDLCQQISYLWAAAGTDRKIQGLFFSGGIAHLPGLQESLQNKTSICCKLIDVFKDVDLSAVSNFDEKSQHLFAVCFGLALRKLGDKRNSLS